MKPAPHAGTARAACRCMLETGAEASAPQRCLPIYGKGGIGKSTTSSNLSVAFYQTRQAGAADRLRSKARFHFYAHQAADADRDRPCSNPSNFHAEELRVEDFVYQGYSGVMCVEAGGPPAGTGCGGYVVGQTVKLLKEHHLLEDTDVVIFDVLGDVVCGGFAAPLQHADRALIVTANDFDSIFAMNRIVAAIQRQRRRTTMCGLAASSPTAVPPPTRSTSSMPRPSAIQTLAHFPDLDVIRRSRLKKATLFRDGTVHAGTGRRVKTEYHAAGGDAVGGDHGTAGRHASMKDRDIFDLLGFD